MAVNNFIRTCFVTCLFIFLYTGYLFSQAPSKEISIEYTGITVFDALDIIAEKGGINLTYNTDLIPGDSIVSGSYENTPVEKVIADLFSQYEVSLTPVEQQYILTLKPKAKPVIAVPMHTISGFLRDSLSGESLIGATIYIPGLQKGTVTNNYGFYSITLPAGRYTVQFGYIGYAYQTMNIELNKDMELSPELSNATNELEPVIIRDRSHEEIFLASPVGQIDVEMAAFSNHTGITGETDVVSFLQSIPGISNFGDGSTYYYVKGGGKDQNIIYIDEAPVYNPSHMLGLTSTFVPEVIKSIDIYSGHIPAEFGDKLSSVIDIYIKDGNRKQLSGNGNFGPLYSTVSLNGPIVKDKASFLVSLRKSHVRWLLRDQFESGGRVSFYDFNTKLNTNLGKKNKLFLNIYGGNDRITSGTDGQEKDGITWGNFAASLRWNRVLNSKIYFNSTLFASAYAYNFYLSIPENTYWQSTINNVGTKFDFTWYLSPKNKLQFGSKIHNYNMNPGNLFFNDTVNRRFIPELHENNILEIALYVQQNYELTEKWTVDYGLRLINWNNTGPGVKYNYADDGSYATEYFEEGVFHSQLALDPRIRLHYQPVPQISLGAGYSRTSQHIHLVSNSISPLTAMEVWLPAGPNVPAQKSNLFSIEYDHILGENKSLNFSAGAYVRHLKNQVYYGNHPNLFLNPLLENELNFSPVNASGLELALERTSGRIQPKISYTLSKAYFIINGRNFRTPYDRLHNFNFYTYVKLAKRITFTLNFAYNSGINLTVPNGFYEVNGTQIPFYSQRFNYQHAYHRMDMALRFQLNKRPQRFEHALTLSVYNVYNRNNYYSVNYNKTYTGADGYFVPMDVVNRDLFYPTGMYLSGILPYINYTCAF